MYINVDIIKALEISGLGIAGVFLFMAIFFLVIVLLDKMFPNVPEKNE